MKSVLISTDKHTSEDRRNCNAYGSTATKLKIFFSCKYSILHDKVADNSATSQSTQDDTSISMNIHQKKCATASHYPARLSLTKLPADLWIYCRTNPC